MSRQVESKSVRGVGSVARAMGLASIHSSRPSIYATPCISHEIGIHIQRGKSQERHERQENSASVQDLIPNQYVKASSMKSTEPTFTLDLTAARTLSAKAPGPQTVTPMAPILSGTSLSMIV